MIDTVILDIGNVLVDVDFMRSIRYYTKNEEEARRCYKAFMKDNTWDLLDKGKYSTEEVMQKIISNDPEMECSMRAFFDEMKDLLIPFSYTDGWIDAIKQDQKNVYILSNWPQFVHNKFEKEMHFLKKVDGYLLSYKEKLTKPDSAFYQLLIDRYTLNPENCVFIDDRQENIMAAEKMGIKGIIFDKREKVEKKLQKLGVKI